MRLVSAAAGLIGFVLLLAFGAYAFFSPTIDTPGAVMGGLGVVGVALWLWLDREALQRAARSQGARFTGASLLLVVLSAAIAVALNVLAHRYDDRIDLTEAGTYTLSDETEKIVKALDRPVEVVAFVSEATPEKSRIDDLLASYKALSDKLTVRELDPIRNPMEAQQHKITSELATVILVSGADQQRVENSVDEEAITNAIVRLTSGTAHRICTTIGHRELDGEDDYSPSGMGAALAKLRGLNYKVDKVNLAKDDIAAGENGPCEVLLAADPQTDFLPMEREIVARFVAEGHAFLLLLDPTHAPALAKDMARYGIAIDDDIVVEENPDMQVAGMDASYLVLDAATFDYHPLTEGLKGMVLFRVARSVRAATIEGAESGGTERLQGAGDRQDERAGLGREDARHVEGATAGPGRGHPRPRGGARRQRSRIRRRSGRCHHDGRRPGCRRLPVDSREGGGERERLRNRRAACDGCVHAEGRRQGRRVRRLGLREQPARRPAHEQGSPPQHDRVDGGGGGSARRAIEGRRVADAHDDARSVARRVGGEPAGRTGSGVARCAADMADAARALSRSQVSG